MASNSDLARKLLHDLRVRKQRLARDGAPMPDDASGNLGYATERSGNTNAQERATNDLVPPRSGHQLRQTKGFSMALTYAFDDGGPLKSAGLPSKGSLMGFFRKAKDRSMQQSPNKQLKPATDELPTITNLEINDIAKETQKLRQILRVRSFSLDFDKGSKEIGNELWKGAMELEQSLKLLANLQEQSKTSTIKRSDGGGNEDDNPIITEKQTRVEKPVFSFDKASKNRKGYTENGMAPKQVSVTSKNTSKLSTNGDSEFQSSQRTNSSKLKHDTGKIPNVIAKLMGLEELRKEINKKIATENRITPKTKSGVVVSTKEAYRSLLSSEGKTKYVKNAETRIQNVVKSNKLTILKNDLEVSKEAILKISELRSQITEVKHDDTKPKDSRNEMGSTRQKVQAMEDTKRLKPMEVKRQKSEAVDEHRVQELKHCGTHERRKRATTKPILQQKEKKEIQSQQPKVVSGKGTCEKMVMSKVRNQQMGKKTEPGIPEGRSMLKKSPNAKADVHKFLKKGPMTGSNTMKEDTTKANALGSSEASKEDKRNEVRASNGGCINSDGNQAFLASQLDTKLDHESATKVLNDPKSQKKNSQLAKKGAMGQNLKTTNKTTRAMNTQQPRLQKGTQRSVIFEASPGKGSLSKATQNIPADTKPNTPGSQQQVDAEQISTQNNAIEDESRHKEIVHGLPTNEKNQSTTISSISDRQAVPDEVQGVDSQRTATDGCDDSRNTSYDLQPTQPSATQTEKQNQLSKDEAHTKRMLITSNTLLNTVEALLKLEIPTSILNHANNQNHPEKNSKLTLDCMYEVLTRKGRNQELLLHPHITTNTRHRTITSLDDLARQLQEDLQVLKCYARNESDEYDYTYVLNMIEKDMHYKEQDLNCMWEIGWKDGMFACMEMEEVVRDVEQEVVEGLVDEIVNDLMLSS